MPIEKLALTYSFYNFKLVNYSVIVPVWDSFLSDLYQSIIYRNLLGVTTPKLDLSIEKNLIDYIIILLKEYYTALQQVNFHIPKLLNNEYEILYIYNINHTFEQPDKINPLVTFNKILYKKDPNLFDKPTIYILFTRNA